MTNQEVDNLQRRVFDLEGKLVKLAALEAAFQHFTNEHWIPLQAVVLSLHDSLCWTCRGMENLSLMEYNQPWLLPPYQLPSPSLCLALDKGQPLPVLHPSLPLLTMSPLSSPTPLPTPPPTHSKWRKDRMDLYGPKKRGQRCRPSSPIS